MSAIEATVFDEVPTKPLLSESVFLSESLQDNNIKSVSLLHRKKLKEIGSSTCRRVYMEDGKQYDVTSYEPLKRVSDISVTMTTPWLTEPKGFNDHMARSLVKRGFPVDLVSAERNVELLPNIHASARNQLMIAGYTADQQTRDPHKLIVMGVSRAAMIGFSVTAQARDLNRDIIYGDYIVPCYPEPPTTSRQLAKLALLPFSESGTVRHIVKFPSSAFRHYPSTFSVGPKKWINHLALIPNLLSGAAGDAAKLIDQHAQGTVLAFKGDLMSQGENWQEIFADHPHMKVILEDGGSHLSCATTSAIDAWKQRVDTLAAELSHRDVIDLPKKAV